MKATAKDAIKYWTATILITGAVTCFAQQLQIQDINQLLGKQVIVQRIPLCQPGTYTVVLTYAGKKAKVISVKASDPLRISETNMRRLTPEVRAMMEEAQHAATVVFQFEDGTKLDSCAPISPNKLSGNLELAPGESLPSQATAVLSTALNNASSAARADLLSDRDVAMAVEGNGKDHWVTIEDMGLMAAQGSQVPSVTLYMPEAILAIGAESARKQYANYEPSEEDRRRSLVIVAEGYAGKTIAEGCTSITRVVLLSDPSGTVVKEAYLSEPLTEVWRNSYGATDRCHALRTKFALQDVEKVKVAAANGEFFVAVFSGSVNTKTYKIKKKHQSKLHLP